MRSTLIVFCAAVLSTFAAAATEVAATPEVQGPGTLASPPVAQPPAAVSAAPEQAPATPAASDEAASAPATADVAVPAETASAAEAAGTPPTTLKLATAAPPADFHPPAGYRAVKSGLETVYCTSYTPIGSRMSQKVCMSREQVEALLRQQDEARRALSQGGGCTGGCGGSN
jgi:hypothetical protein